MSNINLLNELLEQTKKKEIVWSIEKETDREQSYFVIRNDEQVRFNRFISLRGNTVSEIYTFYYKGEDGGVIYNSLRKVTSGDAGMLDAARELCDLINPSITVPTIEVGIIDLAINKAFNLFTKPTNISRQL